MALKGEVKKIQDDGSEKEVFNVSFTNGTFQQLKELQTFLKGEGFEISDDPTEVVRIAIAFLERAKENKDKNNS